MSKSTIQALSELAHASKLASITYAKSGSQSGERIVEAYNFTYPSQPGAELLLRCYQRGSGEGWRFFAVRHISDVQDAGETFVPRVQVTLNSVEVDPSRHEGGLKGPKSPRDAYRELVTAAMADQIISAEEFRSIRDFVRDSSLSESDVRFVHASVFYDCLGAILADAEVDETEIIQIRFVSAVLGQLGWSPAS